MDLDVTTAVPQFRDRPKNQVTEQRCMTKTDNTRQQRRIAITVAILTAIAVMFFMAPVVQNW